MSIIENKKEGNERKIKVFGKTIYETHSEYYKRTQNIFGNFISTVKTIDKNGNEIKNIMCLGKVISTSNTDENYKKTYLLGNLLRCIDVKKRYLKDYGKYFNGYDTIIILNANSGEVYLFLTYVIDSFLKQINAKKTLIIATKKYHIDLISLLCPNISYRYITKKKVLNKCNIKIGEQNFYTLFPRGYFIEVERDIKSNSSAHYFKSIIDELEIKNSEVGYKRINIPFQLKEDVINKVKSIGLDINEFIFVSPEACSCEQIDDIFWQNLCKELKNSGYDIFLNVVNKTDNWMNEYKNCSLTFMEAFILAQMSKGIIILRSGLSEIMLQADVPMICLYTKFKNRYIFNDMDVEHVMSGFGLSQLPYLDLNKLTEVNAEKVSSKEILELCLKKFE